MVLDLLRAERVVVEGDLVDDEVTGPILTPIAADEDGIVTSGAGGGNIAGHGSLEPKRAVDPDLTIVDRDIGIPSGNHVINRVQREDIGDRGGQRNRGIADTVVGTNRPGIALTRSDQVIHHPEIATRFPIAHQVVTAAGRERTHVHPVFRTVAVGTDFFEAGDHNAPLTGGVSRECHRAVTGYGGDQAGLTKCHATGRPVHASSGPGEGGRVTGVITQPPVGNRIVIENCLHISVGRL